jgi:uncharacterized protein
MAQPAQRVDDFPTLGQRVCFLAVYAVALYLVGTFATGSWALTGSGEWVWWLSAVSLYVFSTLSAPFFSRPRDVLANAIASACVLFTMDLKPVALLNTELAVFRWLAVLIVLAVGALALLAIALQGVPLSDHSRRGKSARISYRLAVALGHEAVIFTPPALISIVGFYQQRPPSMLWLTALWILIVTTKPVQLVAQVWDVVRQANVPGGAPQYVGQVTRVDDPNIIRVALTSPATWKPENLHKACLSGNRHVYVIPLFTQVQDDELMGTGLCCDCEPVVGSAWTTTEVWTAPDGEETAAVIQRLSGNSAPVDLIGFLVEESDIAAIRFEVVLNRPLREGTVVFVRDGDQMIFYQLLNAVTKEEMFTLNPRGTHVAVAAQLGTLDLERGFVKYGWVPAMNSPVFLPRGVVATPPAPAPGGDDFVLGAVAQTGMQVRARLSDMVAYHTAVLGVTGTGKTELVLDMIGAHLDAGRKVFCVDFTGEYKLRLKDRNPQELGFAESESNDLARLIDETEFGTFGAPEQKKKLSQWLAKQQPDVEARVEQFITSEHENVAVLELPEIASTRATLRATEMFLSAIFKWARNNRKAREIVVVLEEAHTIIPETSLYRYDKADTDAVVGRMSQIALQGRKYGVGLLLVSQRTALVSKTLLSQCNTCITFAMYDKTGLDYLSSVFASEHVRAIPQLRFLQGIAFGKAIKSERPVIFEIPRDAQKQKASEALNKTLPPPTIKMTPAKLPPIEPPFPEDQQFKDDDIPF